MGKKLVETEGARLKVSPRRLFDGFQPHLGRTRVVGGGVVKEVNLRIQTSAGEESWLRAFEEGVMAGWKGSEREQGRVDVLVVTMPGAIATYDPDAGVVCVDPVEGTEKGGRSFGAYMGLTRRYYEENPGARLGEGDLSAMMVRAREI